MSTESQSASQSIKLFGSDMLADPYPVYHQFRSSRPVYWAPALDAWVVTSYAAVTAGLRNPQLSSNRFERVRNRLSAIV